jgi:autotransporter-associated beta strand protein
MKKIFIPQISLALLLTALPGLSQTVFFTDTFTGGSTLTNATPAVPTATSASYQLVSTKGWAPPPTMTATDFRYGIASTGGGTIECQAIFTTNTVTLTQPGDYIQMVVTFTNEAGILTANGQLDFGLYSSGQTNPISGGFNGNATSGNNAVGGTTEWLGYVGQLASTGNSSRILTRAAQTTTTANNQDLLTTGSSTESYGNPAAGVIGTAVSSTLVLSTNTTYTDVLMITLVAGGSVAITNSLYNGANISAPLNTQYGAVATNATFLTSGFDAFGIGWLAKAATFGGTVIDISSIQISGHETVITGPPLITAQPIPAVAVTNGYAQFAVAATGFDVTYQWYRNGAELANGGDFSGVTAATLAISPCESTDAVSAVNGYYCKVSGAGGFSTNSVTNSLTLYPATNLTWTASGGATWDLNTTVSFEDPSLNPQVFIGGDSVNFIDSASQNNSITMTGNLGPSSMYVSTATAFTFAGSGSIVGPCAATLDGQGSLGEVILNANNAYSGGTLLTNDVYVQLKNYAGLGTGPVTLNDAGGTLETTVTGSATVGINGNVNVLDDFTMQVDGHGTFATVFLGQLSGTSGKTLTINPQTAATTNRFRVYGANMVLDANLALDTVDSGISQALYNGTVIAPYAASGTQTFNGVISGAAGVVQRGSATTVLNNSGNTYSGGTFATAGSIAFGADTIPTSGTVASGPIGTGPLFVAPEVGSGNGSGTVLAVNGARTIANPIEYPSSTNNQTLVIGGTNDLTFTGTYALNGQDGATNVVNRTVQVNNTGATTFSGAITDGGSGFGLVKTGTNTLYLNGANTYTGNTTNTAGLLAGSGSLTGSVIVTTNASVGGGSAASPGTLAISGNLTLTNGNGFFRVNRSGTSDQVSVGGTLVAGGVGTINVANLGAALQAGDSFNVFNKAVTGGLSLKIAGGGGVIWTNNLAVNGSIAVYSVIPTTPTNITVTVNGTALGISWPSSYLGWILQSQTNKLTVGIYTNWVDVPNSANGTSNSFTITATNPAVFYRLRSP